MPNRLYEFDTFEMVSDIGNVANAQLEAPKMCEKKEEQAILARKMATLPILGDFQMFRFWLRVPPLPSHQSYHFRNSQAHRVDGTWKMSIRILIIRVAKTVR